MRIESRHSPSGSQSRSTASSKTQNIMSQPAPAHVDTLRWKLANAQEREELLYAKPDRQPKSPPDLPKEGAWHGEMAYRPATLGAVAGARAVDRLNTTPQGLTDRQFDSVARTVRETAQQRGLGSDIVVQGSRAGRTASPTSDIDLGIRVSPERFQSFIDDPLQSKLASVEDPNSAKGRTRDIAIERGRIHAGEARLSSTAKTIGQDILHSTQLDARKRVDLSVVRRGGPFDSSPTMDVPSARSANARAGGQGALVGGAVDGAFSAVHALRDGHMTGAEARDVLADSARGAVVGGTYAVTEQGLVRAADRVAGSAIERSLGTGARIAGTRLAGAGAAGAVISAGMSVYENRDGLARGDSKAIGDVAGDVVVGGGSALAGAAAGAAIGSAVPVVGTVVGAGVGLVAGYLTDQALRAGGVDKMIGNAVSWAVDSIKGWFR